MNNSSKFNRRLVEFIVIVVSVVFVMPIILVFLTSFKPDAEIIHSQGVLPGSTCRAGASCFS